FEAITPGTAGARPAGCGERPPRAREHDRGRRARGGRSPQPAGRAPAVQGLMASMRRPCPACRVGAALALALLVAARPARAQYMPYFGQNKFSYDNFKWKVYHAPHFDIYYYGASEAFLDDV